MSSSYGCTQQYTPYNISPTVLVASLILESSKIMSVALVAQCSSLVVGGVPSVLLTTASAMMLAQQCPHSDLVLAHAAHWCRQQFKGMKLFRTRTSKNGDEAFQECVEELADEVNSAVEDRTRQWERLALDDVDIMAEEPPLENHNTVVSEDVTQDMSEGPTVLPETATNRPTAPDFLCARSDTSTNTTDPTEQTQTVTTPTPRNKIFRSLLSARLPRFAEHVPSLQGLSVASLCPNLICLPGADGKAVGGRSGGSSGRSSGGRSRGKSSAEADIFFLTRILPAFGIVLATAGCCLGDSGQFRAFHPMRRSDNAQGTIYKEDPYCYSRVATPSNHRTRRGLSLRVIGDRPASEVWRLTLEAPREGRGDFFFLLTNVYKTKLRLDSYVRFLPRRRNAWDLAADINAKLTGGFRVSPRAVQHALQMLVSAGADRPADIISWKIRPRDMIECVGPDHGRGCVPNCPGVLTHLECRMGGVGEFGDCVWNGSFCEKCGINIRPDEMTYRCKACDCDVCEKCVEEALERSMPPQGAVPVERRARSRSRSRGHRRAA